MINYIIVARTNSMAMEFLLAELVHEGQLSKVTSNQVLTNDGRKYYFCSKESDCRGLRASKAYIHRDMPQFKNLLEGVILYSPDIENKIEVF